LPANTQITAVGSNGKFLDTAQSDSNGNLTLDIPLSSHVVTLKDSSDNSAPTQSNSDPANNSLVSSTPSELSIDVNDTDFPDNGDNVTVEFYLDGSKIATKYTEQNGTVTTTNLPGTLDLGSHTWAVNTTDAYGNVLNNTYNFALPSNITLRNETNASEIITGKNITATFYSTNGEVVVRRSDDDQDGNISLRNLPDKSFVVTFEGEGFYDRRAFIESIGEQQNVYLLNSTQFPTSDDSAIETIFVYEDRTGQFEQDNTTLRIERAVDPDNDSEFQFETVAGDFWGAAGEFPFTGEYQARYRLVIKNQQTGDRRVLGTHIPVASGTKNIIVGQIIFNAENQTGRWYDAGINKNTSNLQWMYQDPTNGTTDLTVTIYEHGNKSNELYNQTFSGPLGTQTGSVALTNNQTDTNWIVEFDGDHSEDGSVYGEIIVGSASFPINMDGSILAALAYAGITFLMMLYGPRVATHGAWIGVFAFAGAMTLGWIAWSIPALTIAVVAAAAGSFYKEAMPG
jgi:hypothetical protein